MKIRTLSTLTVVCAASAFAIPSVVSGSSWNDSPIVAPDSSASGTIEKYDAASNSFTLRTGEDKTMEFKVTKETTYTLNGQAATKEQALKVGAKATVSHKDKSATSVAVITD